jgi:WD40 repeat protein
LDLSTLEACCRREIENENLADLANACFSIELLRRATTHDNQQAWEAWQRCFTEVLRSWLRRHPRAEEACHVDSEERYLARTFECFRQAMAAGQLPASTSLPTVLRYLQACLNGVLLDALRSKARPQGIRLQEPADPEELAGGSPPNAHRVSRRTLLLGGIAAVGMAGVASAWRGFAQPSAHTSLEATRSSRPVAALRKGQTLSTYRGHASAIFSVGWSPDGKHIASGSTDTTVQVWDAHSGGQVLTYRGHTSPVLTVAWSPDGKRIVSGCGETGGEAGGETTVQVWNALDGGQVLTYRGHTQPVLAVAWSPDGTSIASGGEDSLIQAWDAATGSMKPSFVGKTYPGIITSLAWSPDGTALAVGGSSGVQVLDVKTGRVKYALLGIGIVLAVAWSPDGTALALGTDQSMVLLCDALTGTWKRTYAGHTSIVNAVAWSPNGTSIASGGFDRTVQVWHATTGTRTVTYRGHTNSVNSLAWSLDGSSIASGSTDTTVQVWLAI